MGEGLTHQRCVRDEGFWFVNFCQMGRILAVPFKVAPILLVKGPQSFPFRTWYCTGSLWEGRTRSGFYSKCHQQKSCRRFFIPNRPSL